MSSSTSTVVGTGALGRCGASASFKSGTSRRIEVTSGVRYYFPSMASQLVGRNVWDGTLAGEIEISYQELAGTLAAEALTRCRSIGL